MRSESDSGTSIDGRRADVLEVLKSAGAPLEVVEIAEQLGVHPNTVRFHLKVLVEQRRVEPVTAAPERPGRPSTRFRAVAGMDPEGIRHYRILAEILIKEIAGHRDVRARARAAGREFGYGLVDGRSAGLRSGRQSLTTLIEVLDDLGFEPERPRRRSDQQINLRHCPFLELARDDARVVCAIHLGLMQGVLEAQQSPQTVERLVVFAEPDLCRAELAPVEAA